MSHHVNESQVNERTSNLSNLLSISAFFKQLLDEIFVMSRIIKVEVGLRLITLTETLIILDITKTESKNCFIIH